jgi:GTP cyclohydrolase II
VISEEIWASPHQIPDGRQHSSEAVVRQSTQLPIDIGLDEPAHARIVSFHGLSDGAEHVMITLGPAREVPLVRVHSECLTGDSFGSLRCDCGPQLRESLRRIHQHGGALLYLRQEGRGIGLYNKIDAYSLQDHGADTFAANIALGFAADLRDYTVATQMLLAVGFTRIELLSNNPEKVEQLRGSGIEVVRMVHTETHANPYNVRYLTTKAVAGRHDIDVRGTAS